MVCLLSQLIDRSAVHYPERPAFRYYDETVTYAKLSRSTSQLANVLTRYGITRGDRVGIFMNKCLQMPLAVHGILKAGAAYVPIDPAAPEERLRFIIQHCGLRVLITQPDKAERIDRIQNETDLKCLIGINIERTNAIQTVSWQAVSSAPADTPQTGPLTEMDIAYIMYTSGSTGEPKGIMHTHHSGMSYAKLSAETFQLSEHDILGNHSPLHFDMSTFEFFSGPLCGACTVLIPEEYTRLPASLSNLMASEKMTIWYSVPFALIQLLLRGVLEERDLSSLRWIMFGGEPIPNKYLGALMRHLPHTRFSNVYGPAEVNQCTVYHVPGPPSDESDSPVPIGRVWNNTQGLVVDAHDRPTPPGKTGELLIRSPTMMQGYWNREDLNQKAFYHRSPFPGYTETFYRTGDLVRMGSDGNYTYIGRKDRQIKTRGYRVELDEIEAALSSHAEVEEAAAYAFPDAEGSMLIGAGVTLKGRSDVSPSVLVNYLKSRLPWYAVPQHIDVVAMFSRTATGKIDRKALAAAVIQKTRPQE